MFDLYNNRRDKHTEEYKEFTPVGLKELKDIGQGLISITDCNNGEMDYERVYIMPFTQMEKILKTTINDTRDYIVFYNELFSGNEVLVNFNNGEFLGKEKKQFSATEEIKNQFEYAVDNWMEIMDEKL